MGYRSQVRIALTNEDFESLYHQIKSRPYTTNNYYMMDHLDFKQSDDTLTVFGWDWCKWYPTFDEVRDIMNFIKKHNSAFVRIGDDYDDAVQEYYEDPDQKRHPFPNALYDTLSITREIVCNV